MEKVVEGSSAVRGQVKAALTVASVGGGGLVMVGRLMTICRRAPRLVRLPLASVTMTL